MSGACCAAGGSELRSLPIVAVWMVGADNCVLEKHWNSRQMLIYIIAVLFLEKHSIVVRTVGMTN